MVRPCSFGFNAETASSNHFQSEPNLQTKNVQEKALLEFDKMVATLRAEGVLVTVFEDTATPHTPDSIFPNNWFSTHSEGTIAIFPMEAENRRQERREDIINHLEVNYFCQRLVDLTDAENISVFLEGTGSVVFDHENRIAYACRSTRTNEILLKDYCDTIDYSPIIFDALDENKNAIYHTNVLMNIGQDYVVICLDAVKESGKSNLVESLNQSGKVIIPISYEQMNNFAGNMLELEGKKGLITVLSNSAFNCLTDTQKEQIQSLSKLVPISINTIEQIGGGSVRCMMAEIFLQRI